MAKKPWRWSSFENPRWLNFFYFFWKKWIFFFNFGIKKWNYEFENIKVWFINIGGLQCILYCRSACYSVNKFLIRNLLIYYKSYLLVEIYYFEDKNEIISKKIIFFFHFLFLYEVIKKLIFFIFRADLDGISRFLKNHTF